MKREDAFDALVSYDSPYGEHFVDTAALAGNHGAAKYLYTLLIAFFDAVMDIDPIAYFEVRCLFPQALTFDSVQKLCFHYFVSLFWLASAATQANLVANTVGNILIIVLNSKYFFEGCCSAESPVLFPPGPRRRVMYQQ